MSGSSICSDGHRCEKRAVHEQVSRGSSLLENKVGRWENAKSGSRRTPQGPAPGSSAVGKEGGPECLGESGVLCS